MAITQPPEIDDHIAALTYQLAEIQIYGENEKGKYPLGCPSDTKLANDESEAEIQTYIEYLNDLKLAISIANAVATDSDVISELIEHERITQWDHEYAARIDDRSIHSNQSEIKQHLSLCDFISNVLADGINDEGCAGPSMTYAERQAKALDKLQEQCQCCVCFESFQATSVPPLPCGDRYCADCLRTLFQNASRDETLFPPRCCRLQIPLENIEHELSREEIRFFLNAEVEFSTENRVYCSNTECAQFIHPQNIQAERALCPACATDTCTACKARYHGRSECLEDPELEATMALAEEQGWQRCYSCRALVELKHGCNHMTCKCGGQFCYICGVPWKQCSCLQWDEARLVVRAQEVVEREAPRAMPRFAMENLVENMREELRDNHECTHGGWLTRVDGSIGTTFRCEICSHRHSNFILQCPRCHLHICATCRRNRLR